MVNKRHAAQGASNNSAFANPSSNAFASTPKNATASSEPDRKIVMAVDFGTTYSGLAWAQTRKPDMQIPIIQWPDATSGGLEGVTSDKVPSEIQYDGQDLKWGFQISDLGQRHQWFKLALDPSQRRGNSQLAARFPDPMASPPGYNAPTAEKLVTDYLTALRKHAEQTLRCKVPQTALQSTPIEFVITVPAVWSDAAQAKTRACAEHAGMGVGAALHIISEPEAAAMYALDAMDPHNIKVGDTFVLCDAGGGTVDLISYKVSALHPLLQIAEASPGSGSLCGSSFLNRIFQKLLFDKFRNEPAWDNDVLEEATNRFESIVKRSFRGTSEEEFQIPVPGLPDNGLLGVRRGRLRLTGADVKSIFDPVVQEVVRLVMGQINATKSPVKAVLLVGGFGQSGYLRDCIRAAVGNVEVMQSPNGWTAVVRGALMKGLASTAPTFASVKVSGRSARKHYGLQSRKEFDATIHEQSRRQWDPYYGSYRICTMDWIVTKGAIVQEGKPERLRYKQRCPVVAGLPQFIHMNVYVCSDPANEGPPIYQNEDVVQLVELVADLSRVRPAFFTVATGRDGKLWYDVDFEVEVTFLSAFTKYELIYKTVNYGAVQAENGPDDLTESEGGDIHFCKQNPSSAVNVARKLLSSAQDLPYNASDVIRKPQNRNIPRHPRAAMGVQDKSASLPPATKVASTPADMKSTRATTASTSRISYTDLTHDDDDVIILGSKKKTATTPRKRRMDEEDATDTATKKKKTATPRKKKDEEQRLKQFRKQAPQLYLQKLSRALEQRMFVLDRTRQGTEEVPEEVIEMAGSTGNIYHVTISKLPHCNCPDNRKGNQCKHIVYVMHNVLKAPEHLQYQVALLSSELREIFANAPPLPTGLTSSSSASQTAHTNRKPIEGDCPICFMPLSPTSSTSNEEPIIYCKAACGNNIHASCFSQWAASRAGKPVTCVYCRAPWQGDGENMKRVKERGKVNQEGYVNVARELGLSGERDVSSYHRPWVRRNYGYY